MLLGQVHPQLETLLLAPIPHHVGARRLAVDHAGAGRHPLCGHINHTLHGHDAHQACAAGYLSLHSPEPTPLSAHRGSRPSRGVAFPPRERRSPSLLSVATRRRGFST